MSGDRAAPATPEDRAQPWRALFVTVVSIGVVLIALSVLFPPTEPGTVPDPADPRDGSLNEMVPR